jgi:gliding motility-associated lipoprotein GldH
MSKPKNAWTLLLAFIVMLMIYSCDSKRVFEQNINIDKELWDYKDIKKFEVAIQDTAIRYNIGVNLRHSFQFEWRNVYVQIETTLPDGKVLEKRVNLLLSEADGKWYGKCFGDNCFIYIPIQSNFIFPNKGKYTFRIKQDMRQNPLKLIKFVGLRIEKATEIKTEEN